MEQAIQMKRGSTLSLAGFAKLPPGTWSASAQIDNDNGAPLATLSVTLTALGEVGENGETHVLLLYKDAESTESWPMTAVSCDIRFEDTSGVVIYSPTFKIIIVKEVTSVSS